MEKWIPDLEVVCLLFSKKEKTERNWVYLHYKAGSWEENWLCHWVSISLWYSWKGKQETHPCEQRKSKWRIWVWVSTSLDPSQHKGMVTLPGKVWGLLTRTSPLTGIWLNSYKQWGSLCPRRSVSDEGGHPSTIHPLWQLLSANSAPKWDLHHADIAQGVGECLPYWQRILSPLVS